MKASILAFMGFVMVTKEMTAVRQYRFLNTSKKYAQRR